MTIGRRTAATSRSLTRCAARITPMSGLCRGGGRCRWWVACSGLPCRHNHSRVRLLSPMLERSCHGRSAAGAGDGPAGTVRGGVRCRVGAVGLHVLLRARSDGVGGASESLAGRRGSGGGGADAGRGGGVLGCTPRRRLHQPAVAEGGGAAVGLPAGVGCRAAGGRG